MLLPVKEEPVLIGAPPLHHGGQNRLEHLILHRGVGLQTAQQNCQALVHVCDTQHELLVQANERQFWHACVCVYVFVSSLSVSCQLMIPFIAKAMRVSLSSLAMMGQSTWTVFSPLCEPDNKLSKYRI